MAVYFVYFPGGTHFVVFICCLVLFVVVVAVVVGTSLPACLPAPSLSLLFSCPTCPPLTSRHCQPSLLFLLLLCSSHIIGFSIPLNLIIPGERIPFGIHCLLPM